MVVLSGSHTIGRSHCASFIFRNRERLANGTINPVYQALLEVLCPANTSQLTLVTMHGDGPQHAGGVRQQLLQAAAPEPGPPLLRRPLIHNATLVPSVSALAANKMLWKERFTTAMIKMGNIEVMTGSQGEVLLNCSVVNPSSSMIIDRHDPTGCRPCLVELRCMRQ
jgi:peroxidase